MPDSIPWWFIPVCFGLFGACIGSFLNVVIYRVPREISINEPARSFCPTCNRPIPWYLNIPIVSWCMLRGRSACCHEHISFRYCLVESGTAILFGLMGYLYAGASFGAALCLCLWLTMAIIISFIDAEHQFVYRRHTIIGSVAGTLACILWPFLLKGEVYTSIEALKASLIGAVVGYVIIRLIIEAGKRLFGRWGNSFDTPVSWELREPVKEEEELQFILDGEAYNWSDLFHRASDKAVLTGGTITIDGHTYTPRTITIKADTIELDATHSFALEEVTTVTGTTTTIKACREAMGSGDAWILLMIGALTGWQGCLFCLFIGSLLGILQAVIMRIGRGVPIPFGPSLLAAAVIWLLGGSAWWTLYLKYVVDI